MYEKQKRYSRKKFREVADIGEIPPVENPERREACRLNLLLFLSTYFPASTGLSEFGDDQKRVISRIQTCALDGGLFVQAMPRGYSKTTISENSVLWAVLYGHRKFVPIFGADSSAAEGNIDSIKQELESNDLLYADFPEVCHAIRALEGKPQRCASQTYAGERTHIEWRADTIVLPTIKGSVASGAIIKARGIMGASRGMKHKRPDGTQQRPDLVIIDDPQTDESASTELQVRKRLDIIRKSILKLGGHNRRIAVVVNATVIRPGDLVEQLLDPTKFPAWQGERIKMVKSWSKAHDTLWLGDYARLRNTFDPNTLGDQERAHKAATEFYRSNREKMDEGCVVSWDNCYEKGVELSAIQHAYNLLIDDGPDVFASECQNEPLQPDDQHADALSPDEIAEKCNRIPRGTAPAGVSRVVSFIDVQKHVLYWMVMGFEEDFTGYVMDYGMWPEQRQGLIPYNKVRNTIQRATKADSLEAGIYAALDRLTGELMSREFPREDGAKLRIERAGIDANWGESTDVVYQFCRQSAHAALLLPSHGKYVGATSKSFSEWKPKPGDRQGLNWRMPNVSGRRSVRYLLFDSNAWKTFVAQRLRTGMGGKGCMSFFGDNPDAHRTVAEHLTAETGILVEAKGRVVTEWKLKPSRPDNHLLDCAVGCHVLASVQGVGLLESRTVERKRVKLSDLQRMKASR